MNFKMLDINRTPSNGSLPVTSWNATTSNVSQTMTSLIDPPNVITALAYHETTSEFPHDVTTNASAFYSNVTMMSATMRTATEVANMMEFKLTPVVCSIGLVLNVVNLLVLTERGLKESPYIYLRALSLTDFSALLMTAVFLVVTSPAGPSGFITSDGTTTGDFGVFYGAYIFLPLTSICNNASTWIIITLTIERFLFVRSPLWARDTCTPSSAKLKTLVVMVVITLVNVPRFMYYRVASATPPSRLLQIKPTVFRYSRANEKVLWFYSVMFGVVPLLILCVTNSYLIYAVKKARKQRRLLRIRNNMEAHWNREQTRLTLTLISIVCLAVICILPAAFGDVVVMSYLCSRSATLRQFLDSPFYKVFRSVSNLLLTCNMSLNFVLYSAFNDKFVRVMKKMVRRWLHQLTGKKPTPGVLFIGAGTRHRAGVKNGSNASKEGSSLTTKISNVDNTHHHHHHHHHHHQHNHHHPR